MRRLFLLNALLALHPALPIAAQQRADLVPPRASVALLQTAMRSTPGSQIVSINKGVGFTARLEITDARGMDPALDLSIQATDDGGINWHPIPGLTFGRMRSAGVEYQVINTWLTGNQVKAVYAISGEGAEFTFKLDLGYIPESALPARSLF